MTSSPLKTAFSQWRAGSDIKLMASVFRKVELFVAGNKTPLDKEPVFYLTRSKNPERVCVTVSESTAKLGQLPNVSLIRMTGSTLLKRLGPLQEVIIVYDDGGDYLTAEQLAWMRQNP
jgi:hypothetical protein